MEQQIKISIVTIVYNGSNEIEETILSVINQDYSNIEYIVIDGKSNDGTVKIIQKYENRITRFISEADTGIYDAKNKGIKLSTGKWINFMNAGDKFASTTSVSEITKYLTNDYNIVYGDCLLSFNKQSEFIYKKSNDFNIVKYHIPFCHQACFVKTDLMREFLFEKIYSCTGDYNFFFHVYSKGKHRPLKVNIPICIYDMNGVSNSLTALKEYYLISLIQSKNMYIHFYHLNRYYYALIKKRLKFIFNYLLNI